MPWRCERRDPRERRAARERACSRLWPPGLRSFPGWQCAQSLRGRLRRLPFSLPSALRLSAPFRAARGERSGGHGEPTAAVGAEEPARLTSSVRSQRCADAQLLRNAALWGCLLWSIPSREESLAVRRDRATRV